MTRDPIPLLSQKDVDRFWAKVKKTGACWQWQASKCGYRYEFGGGYGQFGKGRKSWYAHRIAWHIAYGEIPAGMFVCHRCDNQSCVRPGHLFLGTPLDNGNHVELDTQ